jgi:four helix bundle protein
MQDTQSKSRSYRDLEVWNLSIFLLKEVYLISNRLPSSENFGLTKQIRRAAVSIPANIAEGQGRHSRKGYRQFLALGLGSIAELETQVIIAKEIEYLTSDERNPFLDHFDRLRKMIKGRARGIA